MQSALINTALNYDCTTFDENGVCLSVGGRLTETENDPSSRPLASLLVASIHATPNLRFGGYLDYGLSNVTSTRFAGDINTKNNNPMAGFYAVWNQNTNGTGFAMRLAANMTDNDLTITRNSGLNTQAGSGDASLRSQAVSATISHGMQLNDNNWVASPYVGMRHIRIKRGSYAEAASSNVSTPISYSALVQENTTAMLGASLNGQLGEKVFLHASAGVERDLSNDITDYVARFANTSGSLAFAQDLKRTRAVAQAGLSFAIAKNQSLGAQVNFRQEAHDSSNSVTGLVNYQIGF